MLFRSYRQMRRTCKIVVCKGKVDEFIKSFKPYSEDFISQTMEGLFNKSKTVGYFPNTNLNDAHDGMSSFLHSFFAVYASVNKGENILEEGPEYSGGYHFDLKDFSYRLALLHVLCG